MDNSNTTASINTSASPQAPTLAIFKAGDSILCPSLGSDSYKLFLDDESGYLSFIVGVNKYHALDNGKQSHSDKDSFIFHKATTNQTLNYKQPIFNIGDVVLCPSLSDTPFSLTADPYAKRDLLSLIHDGSHYYYDDHGYFVSACDDETDDYQPSLFPDTPSNRQAINTLYGNASATQSSQRKVIDTTSADDDEVVLLKSSKISNNAGELSGAIDVLDDMSSLLGLIYNGNISHEDTKSLARLTQTTVDTWAEVINSQLERLNEILTFTKFSKVGE